MKKIIFGCTLLILAMLWVCSIILAGFIVCIGLQSWSFTQYGFSHVINQLSVFSILFPIIIFVTGGIFIYSGFKEDNR